MKEVSFQESKFVEKFTIFASKMGNEIHLRSLRDAFATIMPLYILAGLAVLINNTVFVWLLSGDTLTGAQYWGTVITKRNFKYQLPADCTCDRLLSFKKQRL